MVTGRRDAAFSINAVVAGLVDRVVGGVSPEGGFLTIDEFLHAVDAPQFQHRGAHGGFEQHRQIAAGCDGQGDAADRHAEDGFVLPGGRPPIRGRQAIEEYYADHGGPLSLRALAFAVEGSVGFIIGGYTREKGEPDIGKFTLTLRKGPEGRWLIMSDMDNSNRRPQR